MAQEAVKTNWVPLGKYLAPGATLPKAGARTGLLTQRLYNRDLSWLKFNERVLAEAEDRSVPALERLRFVSIVSSNLDEFFMVRVADVARMARRKKPFLYPDGIDAPQLLGQIREQVLRQKARQHMALNDILDALRADGIDVRISFDKDRGVDRAMRNHLAEAPILVLKADDKLPELVGERIYVFVRFSRGFAIVDLGDAEKRLVDLGALNGVRRYALAERWLAESAKTLFPERDVIEAFPFKILRDADLDADADDATELEELVLAGLRKRPKEARIIRLEVDSKSYSEGTLLLATQLGVESAALYRFDLPLGLKSLAELYRIPGYERLRYPEVLPRTAPFLENPDLFAVLRRGDVILHHPYDSFDVVTRFLAQAAVDPDVKSIAHCLYRTSAQSPIVEALKEAARLGKEVTVYVELRARFDELANVHRAEELRQAGVKVVRPIKDFKVHSKVTRVTRLENGVERVYTHLGTGNYHPGTARQYTDLGLLTSDPVIGGETGVFYQALTQRATPPATQELFVAPGGLHQRFLDLIKNETRIQKAGGRGSIKAKMNSLVDPDIIEALYEASNAGVQIRLCVRGICCLRPGIQGLSENITVMSVVDRFLEHSRIYYFRNGGQDEKVYLSSADWMPRNFYSRYEIAFPVKDARLKRFVRKVVLETTMLDNVKAWEMGADGIYRRRTPAAGKEPLRSQEVFQNLARDNYVGTPIADRFKNLAG